MRTQLNSFQVEGYADFKISVGEERAEILLSRFTQKIFY